DTISDFTSGILAKDPEKPDPNSYDLIFGLVRELHGQGFDVLVEGLLLTGDIRRARELHEEKLPVHIVSLDLPVEQCIEAVKSRREAKGNENEFNPANTIQKWELQKKCNEELEKIGLPVHHCDTRELGMMTTFTLLGLGTPPAPVILQEVKKEKKPKREKKQKEAELREAYSGEPVVEPVQTFVESGPF